MLALNHVVLAGNLTRDPEVRLVGAERSVANFSLALHRRFKGPDGDLKEETTFVDCEAWGRTAEVVGQYLTKGSPVYCEGRLRLDSWQDKEGQKRSRLKVVVDQVQFLQRRADEAGTGTAAIGARPLPRRPMTAEASAAATVPPAAPAAVAEDEPPF